MIRIQIPGMFEIGIPEKEPVENRYDNPRYNALLHLSWVLNCWGYSMNAAYTKGVPRRVEAYTRIQEVCSALRPHLDPEEWYQFRKGLVDEETGEAYDLQ